MKTKVAHRRRMRYQIEQNANTVLGLFLQMIAKHVRDYGKLRIGDILQYLTLPEVVEITGNPELTYKTFFIKGNAKTGAKNKKVQFDKNMPETMTDDEYLNASYKVKQENEDKDMEISKVNPTALRDIKYMVTIFGRLRPHDCPAYGVRPRRNWTSFAL